MSTQVLEALKTIARRKCPNDFHIDEDDKNRLLRSLQIAESTVSCPANIQIRVYSLKRVKRGAAGGACGGTAVGCFGGAVTGGAVGILVPIYSGNIIVALVGWILGGVIGMVAGAVGGGAVGACAGAGIGALVRYANPIKITARKIFQELPGFEERDNTVFFSCMPIIIEQEI